MYEQKGGGGSTAQVDWKRINDVLDKHLERSSPSTSRTLTGGGRDKDRLLSAACEEKTSLAETKRSDEESETDSEESDISGSDGGDTSWISWFCNLRGNEFFCEVDDDYIQDDFNLCGLSGEVPYYDYALDLILDVESSPGDTFTEEQNELIESAAEMLYGLIHVRYILTSKGMAAMVRIQCYNSVVFLCNFFLSGSFLDFTIAICQQEKYKNAEFGRCPRVYCCGQPCLPVGQSDIPRQSTIKIFCPKCEDVYSPRSRFQTNIDGAYFGTTFSNLFVMTYGHLKPQKASQSYVSRVFGFKVHRP